MIKKFLFIILIFLIGCSYFVSAEKVAYILKIPTQAEQKYIDILQSMNFTVELMDDDNLIGVDFSEYAFSLIGDGRLNNVNYLPVNKFPSLILNNYHLDDFHWSSSSGVIGSSGILQLYLNNSNNFITKDFPSIVDAYTIERISYRYLPKEFKSPYLKIIASLISDHSDAVIATADVGTRLKDKVYSNAKGVFFGVNQYNYWTSYSEQLFRNSVLWLTTDFNSPIISNINVNNLTNESAKINWTTDKLSNSTVFYGKEDLNLNFLKTNSSFVTNHQILIEDLEQLTTYYYKVKSCNEDGYCNNSTIYNFSTLKLTPPNLISTSVTNITNNSVNVLVNTSENANLTLFYGTNQNYLNNKKVNSLFNITSNIFVDNLNENTLYFYKLKMCDIYSNCANSSLFNFTTLDFTPPNMPQNLTLEVINNDNNIKISWQTPPGENVAEYNIYISDMPNLNNFDFVSPHASTTSKEYTDNNASSATKRFYIVRAEDIFGNEENNEIIVGKFDLELDVGYNLISFPLIPFDSDVNKVMHQDAIYKPISEIKKYDDTDQKFKTIYYNYASNEWATTIDFDKLIALDGYFFKSNQKTNFTIVGYVPSEISLNIVNGMNLVGLTLFENKNISEIIIQLPSNYNVTEIASRNSNGSYEPATYYPTFDNWFMKNEFTLNEGSAYWLKANKNFILKVN